jgi:hypothetical protein
MVWLGERQRLTLVRVGVTKDKGADFRTLVG